MLILHDVHTIENGLKDVAIEDGTIRAIGSSAKSKANNETHIYFDDALIFPGLINSHDHLDFNLFPRLGNGIYKNYLEWGDDIHSQNKTVINHVLQVPKKIRTQWGIYKNLLNGITTVFNHGGPLEIQYSPIDVFQDKGSLHSVRLEKSWKWKLNDPFRIKSRVVIHAGEGTDEESHEEINALIKWNKLHKKLIAIHGVAMDVRQAAAFQALVWCPDSNLFLLGKTAAVNELKHVIPIVFGTDSTVSADWSIWNQLRIAKETGLLTNEELMASVTSSPAKLRGLHAGVLEEGTIADLVVAEKKIDNATDAFFAVNAESILIVIKSGNIVLFDESLQAQLGRQRTNTSDFCRIAVNDRFKYVKADVSGLLKKIRHFAKDISLPIESAEVSR